MDRQIKYLIYSFIVVSLVSVAIRFVNISPMKRVMLAIVLEIAFYFLMKWLSKVTRNRQQEVTDIIGSLIIMFLVPKYREMIFPVLLEALGNEVMKINNTGIDRVKAEL